MPNPRRSNELKKLSGTYRRDRDKAPLAGDRLTEPVPAPDTATPGARQEWDDLMPVLVELGTVCTGDLRALLQLAETLATANTLQAIIEADGILLKTGGDGFKANPAQRSLETARNQAARMFEQFGLTPKARNYVSRAPGPEAENPYDHLDDFE